MVLFGTRFTATIRYGNRTNVTATGAAADSSPIPIDGVPNLIYDNASNRITTSGYEYDVAGNMTRALAADGTNWLKYEYDAANRLRAVRKDDVNLTVVQAFVYGSTNARLIDWDALGTGLNTFYASVGGQVLAEYVETVTSDPTWTKSYTYLGDTQLSTVTTNGSSGENIEYSHPDRLGAKVKTNQSAGTSSEQASLPFGTALNAESTLTNNTRRFTSYERSSATGLDYAINRTYDSKLGRFTQVDPIGMKSVNSDIPQTLNLYNYCGNDPVNQTDSQGLFWGAIKRFFKTLGKVLLWVAQTIPLDQAFISAFQELTDKFLPKAKSRNEKKEKTGGKYLLILTNEGEVEFESSSQKVHSDEPLGEPQLPVSVLPTTVLKEHQKRGLAWLQRNFELGRSGCLLADDMGLGKTLQLLAFLAGLIERGGVISNAERPELPPWKPILIVAPVILVENETWINDMRSFFAEEGSIFWPCLTLRGASLNALKRACGRETKIGEATLDIEGLHKYRVVITNYETVVNYQHSFAKTDWSVIVTDEAQEYKTPSTKVSHALKSLSAGFRVACTGTPVETKISDVWNIFDFVEPGKLGSAQDFRAKYEKPLEAESEVSTSIQALKERLLFNTPSSYLLRRDKNELTDLPRKHEHELACELMPSQKDYHLSLLSRAAIGGQANHPFKLIPEFFRVYQHPSLVPHFQLPHPERAIADCHKLSVLVMKLEEIKRLREKALIFVRTLDMQQILADVLKHRFRLSVNIVNGSTKNGASSTDQPKTRKGIISRFRESSGFDVLILSPEVAGMGLTLTEANHVFHYGRWWNPAKEAQATDRVFRIGQEKDVHIYQLITKDIQNPAFSTFDQKLDQLLRRRLALAKDFLTPLPAEDDLSKEFMTELFSS